MQLRSGIANLASRYLISQNKFDEWASNTKPRNITLTGMLLLLIAVACSAAIILMGPRLVREGALLWFGSQTEGHVQRADIIRVGAFKDGAPKYRLELVYDFVGPDGTSYTGMTTRSDVRTPPSFEPGDAIGVFYDRSNPKNSVAEHNLRIDVYALLLFLPWLAIFGLAGPAFYFRRWWTWKRRHAAQSSRVIHTTHKITH